MDRPAARPMSAAERERYSRILRSARGLTEVHGEDAVAIQAVAKEAGVALNTLYRYFPSKAHLFAGIFEDEVNTLVGRVDDLRAPADGDPTEAVLRFLTQASDSMLARPRLARAIMNASAASAATRGESVRELDDAFERALLTLLRIDEPTEEDHRTAWVLILSWSAALGAVLNGRMDEAEFAGVVRLLVDRLLRP